jgi:hypothetical protein
MAEDEHEHAAVGAEEEVDVHFEPLVKLVAVEVQTGEADEDPILIM